MAMKCLVSKYTPFDVRGLPADRNGTGLLPLVLNRIPRISAYLIRFVCQCRGYVLHLSAQPIILDFFGNGTVHWS